MPQLLKPTHHASGPQEKPQREARAPQLDRSPHSQLEKAHTQQQRPVQPNKQIKIEKKKR